MTISLKTQTGILCVRHGDRIPYNKIKIKSRDKIFLNFFEVYVYIKKEIILKAQIITSKNLDITKNIINHLFFLKSNF